MANADSTLANIASSKAFNKQFSAYTPIVLMDGEYDEVLGIGVGKSLSLEPITNKADALEAARIAYTSTPGAVGYLVKGVDHE